VGESEIATVGFETESIAAGLFVNRKILLRGLNSLVIKR
jgi:hypothetical protein